MKVLQLISLLLLAASPVVEARRRNLKSEKKGDKDKEKGGGGTDDDGLDSRLDINGDIIDFGNGNGNASPYGIEERGDCIDFDSDLVQSSIKTAGNDHDDICDNNGCGSANSPGCCRFHYSLLRCDVDNDFSHQPVSKSNDWRLITEYHLRFQSICSHLLFYQHQCVCNSFTKSKPVPTAAPTVSSAPSAFVEDRLGGIGFDVIVSEPTLLKDSCQVYNPASIYFKEDHPHLTFAEEAGFDTCTAGDGCPAGYCCNIGLCMCFSIHDETFCLPDYTL
jgi:hypothetical protein